MRRELLFSIALLCSRLSRASGITVSTEGAGDFTTIQQAITAVPENSATKVVVHVKPGIYQGPAIVPKNKPNLDFKGDDPEKTIITWNMNVFDPIPAGSDKFNPGMQVQANDFSAENLTIQNTSGDHGQALALRVDSDRVTFTHCRMIGWQDTLMINNGRQYFRDCYIAGRVDFIYGSGTAVFDHCEIHSRNGGHVTAASTPQDHPYGFVFLNCNLTGDANPWIPPATGPLSTQPIHKTAKADLGRPWRPYAAVAYLNCEMADHIKPEGWNNWGKTSNEKTARYAEYNSTGPGGQSDKRYAWSKQLTKEEADQYTVSNILSGSDGWNPAPASTPRPTTLP